MEEKKYNIDNFDEITKEKINKYFQFMENFDRSIESIGIKKPEIFGVATKDNEDVIKIKLKFYSEEQRFELRKLMNANKEEEAYLKEILYGIKEWNIVDNNNNIIPITYDNIKKLNDILCKILNTLVRAKNKEPDVEEIENFLIF